MDSLSALADAVDAPRPVVPSTSPASRVPVTLLCACFAFLTPKELMTTHATSKGWQAAAEHPHTFRAQIKVQVKEKTGR
jgi:hypothetical protein